MTAPETPLNPPPTPPDAAPAPAPLSGGAAMGPSAEQIAQIAAAQALLVPGVIRLQPGLRHAVGRAARALVLPGTQADDRSAADGIEIRTDPDPQLTLRIVTTADPTPRATAGAVQDAVTAALLQRTGRRLVVVVVVVDVDADG